MTAPPRRPASPERVERSNPLIRLDGLANPYGPSLAVGEALAASDGDRRSAHDLAVELQHRVAMHLGVGPRWVALGNGADELLHAALLAAPVPAPVLVFPPAAPHELLAPLVEPERIIELRRNSEFRPDVDLETAAELPDGAVAVIGSPSDPTGTALPVIDAVRLCRACSMVIIDERNGGYGSRSLLPVVREFENAVVIQTLETWAALEAFPVAWVAGHPKLLARLAKAPLRRPAAGALIAGLATLDDLTWVLAMTRRVREERSRLYRMLRKLNLVQPFPSWAGFVLARVERGDADYVAEGLVERGILVARPAAKELANCLRISAGRPEETDALKRALVEVALLV